ncbi:purine-nucleoside phosphorylase [Glycomyces xiaoerkulensis]|uniref:purine-nucleoside phosphorylase n=1 Tax=Glycomyces xiaoerkulensis TaxID=2038139 RepID=UPI000C269444|nr:purine-nucleoside phosphorylase [Glycomyces xiaoerkulensis]
MTAHIAAEPGDIAETVLLPGDPLRAKWIAETFLSDAECYSEVRGMYGYTGTYRGRRVSVQGTGMGQPSASIYTHELLDQFGVRTVVRVGSAGAVRSDIELRDVVAAIGASTNSSMNRIRFGGAVDYAPVADFGLLRAAADAAEERGIGLRVGQLYSSDTFYSDAPDVEGLLADYGVLAIEMEAAAIYTLAAGFGARALAICTISDHILNQTSLSAEDRQESFSEMAEIALDTVTVEAGGS